jgi:hypothetical protein
MNVKILLSISILIAFSISVSNGTDNEEVNKAISLQQQVINDPLFEKIIYELEAEGSIDWNDGRTDNIKMELPQFSSNSAWLLSKFKKWGGYKVDSVILWKKINPLSSTTAVTIPCGSFTKLNKRKLDRDLYSILNTISVR